MAITADYSVRYRRIEETVVEGMRLGRHERIDSRSARFPFAAAAPRELADTEHRRYSEIFNQLKLGSCTGESQAGECGSDPFWPAAQAAGKTLPDQVTALAFYHLATTLDGYPGTWQPDDTGSDGTAVSQGAKNEGWIAGYLHAATVADVCAALMDVPVKLGINWYSSYDQPDASGLVKITPGAVVRGGHEIVCRRLDVGRRLIGPDNSWGPAWGVKGSFWFSWDDLDRLLSEGGDCTVSVPLSSPAPVPVPVPAVPDTPTPADVTLAASLGAWPYARHTGANKQAAADVAAWEARKGLKP